MPQTESLYWKRYNIVPDGKMSKVNFRRGVLAQFADPETVDLLFKHRFKIFQEDWEKQFDWKLFKPLSKKDENLFTALRIPLTNDQLEFDSQILALTKTLIDSLNEKSIAKTLTMLDKNSKGITKFELFLQNNKLKEAEFIIKYFRNLQELRSSGVGHRKSKNYEKISKTFRIEEHELMEVCKDIFTDAIKVLDLLNEHFLTGDKKT